MGLEYAELVKFKWASTEIATLASVQWSGLERETIDVLHATEKRKRASTRLDYGELSVSFPYDTDSTAQAALYSAFTANTDGTAQIIFSGTDGTANETWSIPAQISAWDFSEGGLDNEGQINAELTLIPTGTPTAS